MKAHPFRALGSQNGNTWSCMSGTSLLRSIFNSYPRMAWKKLNFKLENHHYDIIEAFIAKTFGNFSLILKENNFKLLSIRFFLSSPRFIGKNKTKRKKPTSVPS